ncbi:hypothetical protein NESM_000858300 [Novymonas esmeraldas]|uniref:Transmembrane protein n=1 Tax=Novymonas esmeraldas TaxID=1808958 RepID=A0AAW0EYH2_9TRYP
MSRAPLLVGLGGVAAAAVNRGSPSAASPALAGAWRRVAGAVGSLAQPPPSLSRRLCLRLAAITTSVGGGGQQRRCMTYSTFDAMRRRKAARLHGAEAAAAGPAPPAAAAATMTSSTTTTSSSSSSSRPLQSSVQRRKEAEMAFPQTLKSGRPAQQNTRAQQIFYANRANAADMAHQQQLDREYTQQMRELHAKRGGADRRFFQRMTDYRDVQDSDPYASVFGESGSTQRLRTAAWQRQFEKENEDVELPYERTNVLARLAPNWFVRYFVNLRDSGGADHLYFLLACGTAAASLLLAVGYLFYTAPHRARPTSEIR